MRRKERLEPGTVLRRLAAFILDILILDLIVVSPFHALLDLPSGIMSSFEYVGQNSEVFYPILFFIVIFSFFYFVLMEYLVGQTVGKMIMDLKVVSENGLTLSQVILRSIFLIPIFPFTILWILDPLFLFIITKNRRLSDIISNTRVRGDSYAE